MESNVGFDVERMGKWEVYSLMLLVIGAVMLVFLLAVNGVRF